MSLYTRTATDRPTRRARGRYTRLLVRRVEADTAIRDGATSRRFKARNGIMRRFRDRTISDWSYKPSRSYPKRTRGIRTSMRVNRVRAFVSPIGRSQKRDVRTHYNLRPLGPRRAPKDPEGPPSIHVENVRFNFLQNVLSRSLQTTAISDA
jgi:hypothetical protein